MKDVIDGDLCEQFAALDAEARARVAEDMDHSVGEILKRLEDLRAAIVDARVGFGIPFLEKAATVQV